MGAGRGPRGSPPRPRPGWPPAPCGLSSGSAPRSREHSLETWGAVTQAEGGRCTRARAAPGWGLGRSAVFPLALVPAPVCGAWVISWVLMTHPPAASHGLCRSSRKPATLEDGPGEGACPGLLEFHSYSFAPGVQVRPGVATDPSVFNVASERPNQDHIVREQRPTRWQGRPHRDEGA